MLKKIKEFFKKYLNEEGAEVIAIALIFLFIILVAAGPIKNLGKTTGDAVTNLNTQMENTLSGQ